jgi:outer membrane protein, multidrug efflux system
VKLIIAFMLMTELLATCAPPYNRPDASVPSVYRGGQPTAASSPGPSMGDLGWWQLYEDPVLLKLVATAISQNYDVNIAYQRIQQAQAQYTIAAANLYPSVNAALGAPYNKTNGALPPGAPSSTFNPNGLLTLSYEVDLFGKVSSQTQAARANALASEFAQEAVMTALVSSVATLYFQLLELDAEMRIAQDNLGSRQKSLDLVRARLEGGVGTLQDVRQAEQLVDGAAAAIPLTRNAIEQTENMLSILLGNYPNAIPRGLDLRSQIAMPDVPNTGLPSELLERRPDIRASEEQLIAANAQIGVAKALLFPQITIGASAGGGSAQYNGLWFGQGYLSLLPQLMQQIFNAGALRANVAAAQAAKQQAVLSYLQAIHQAVSDVSNSLVQYKEYRVYTKEQSDLTAAADDSTRLAQMRYEGGVTSYLEVLDSETRSFTAEIELAQAELNERLALVNLYAALGGGWQAPPPQQAPAQPTPPAQQ